MGEMRYTYKILARKSVEKRQFGICKHRLEGNISVDLERNV
jgi:hypothetical protein